MKLFDLIIDLCSTCSPKDQKESVKEYIIRNRDILSEEDVNNLLMFFSERIEAKKLQGEEAVKLRKEKSKTKQKKGSVLDSYKKPMFVKDYNHKQNCAGCNGIIDSKYAFRWKKDGVYLDFHILPSCWPENEKDTFGDNSSYKNLMNGKK